ncbi:hypothetical protein [Proteus mirabilis]|uniref:hypothetical protein n=1 Tax=Proteus mirabilis TaxID=584 RepID=UPI0034D7B350
MSSQTVLVKAFGGNIESFVSNPKLMRDLQTYIIKYMDRNHEVIFAQGPLHKLFFSKADQAYILDQLKISDKEVKTVMKGVKSVKASWQVMNNPFLILCCLMIREMYRQKKDREAHYLLMFMSLKIYSGLFQKYFKHGVTEQIMNFTINDLSDKFKYKTLGNNYKVIEDIVTNSDRSYREKLLKGEDEDILKVYLIQIFNRLNKVICNIARNYYNNRASKRYLNTVRSFDDEEGGAIDFETSDGVINSLAENVTTYFVSSSVNVQLVKSVSLRNHLPNGTVFQTLTSIKKDEKPSEILNMMKDILSVIYEADNGLLSRICTRQFAVVAIKQLSVSNTKNESLIRLKDKLDQLLNEYCSKYAMTDRKATKMSYRNALYSYFVYLIIINKCG